MNKKIISIALAGALTASIVAGSAISASATVNADGTYTPTDASTKTYTAYCAMPGAWLNAGSATTGDTIGCYWWEGTDAAGALDGSGGTLAWPGYKANKVAEEGIDNLYSMQIPTDIKTIVWSNYLDGGADPAGPYFYDALQTANSPFGDNGYCEDDDTYYDEVPGFWDEINDAFDNDEAEERYGANAAAFFEHPKYGLTMGFNNMIWVVDLDPSKITESELTPGKYEYHGEWYFYYGNGEYGAWPTKELNDAHKDDGVTVSGNIMSDDYWKSQAVTADPNATTPAPSPDATSATKAAATGDSSNNTNNNANGAVATGATSVAALLLIIAAGAAGVILFTRKRTHE